MAIAGRGTAGAKSLLRRFERRRRRTRAPDPSPAGCADHKAAFGKIKRPQNRICGDITHSRVARSNLLLLNAMGAQVNLVGPRTLIPADAERLGANIFHTMREGLEGCDIVMMLRIQNERMQGALIPSVREYYHLYGLNREKLGFAKPNALVMHPGR